MKQFAFFLLIVAIFSCTRKQKQDITQPTKIIDLDAFSIRVPKDWEYKPMQGLDSFTGYFKGPKVAFMFDYSSLGQGHDITPADTNEIKKYVIVSDTVENLIMTIIHPKVTEKGITGVCVLQRDNRWNGLHIIGHDLPKLQQEQALAAFKTIKFKE
jgi:hypothetical protein